MPPQQPAVPPVGADVTDLMSGAPPVGEDVSALMGGGPDFRTTNEKDAAGNAVVGGGFFSEATKSLNPRLINQAIQQAFWHPIQTVAGMHNAQDKLRIEAGEAFKKGDTATGIRKTIDWLIPLLGPRLSEAGDYGQQGDVPSMLGATTDVAVNLFGGKALPKAVPLIPRTSATGPVAEAVQFGLQEGIPVDVATAGGNRFARTAQRLGEESLLGSQVSQKARGAQAAALEATGERLAARGSPLPVTGEQAGQAARDAVTRRVARYKTAADVAYTKLRRLEAQAAQPVQVGTDAATGAPIMRQMLAVYLAPTKQAMRPIYQALVEENALVPFASGSQKGQALVALERLMKAPDVAPLSVADSALGQLKGLARVDDSFRRTPGQGIAAKAVTQLEQDVKAAAQRAGPDALRALMEGRAATVNKFKTIDVLDRLRTEPVQVFRQATWAKDAGIGQLRELARLAPKEVRQIGRAWLEEALSKATREGGFERAQGLLRDWQNLGPETKALLFKDAAHVKDLDHFFLLAKKLAENPNPSGSALTMFKGAELTKLGTELFTLSPGLGLGYTLTAPVVAKLLLSPTTTRLLLQGLRLPVNAKVARVAWAGQLGRVLEAEQAEAKEK